MKHYLKINLSVVLCSVMCLLIISELQAASFTGLGDLPGGSFQSFANGVSADGSTVVGSSNSTSGSEAFRWTSGGGMVGLGDLAGGNFSSEAFGVSADGSVVVGRGTSALGNEAFRWTSGSGVVGLGDLSGGSFSSQADGVSADGLVVVGQSNSASGTEAFIWDQTNGMRNLKDLLVNDFGLDLTGWTLGRATGISADGLTIVGYGAGPNGTEGWIACLRPCQANIIGDINCDDVVNMDDFIWLVKNWLKTY